MMVPVVDDGDSANETIGEAVAEQTANIDTVEEASTINNGDFNEEPPVNESGDRVRWGGLMGVKEI